MFIYHKNSHLISFTPNFVFSAEFVAQFKFTVILMPNGPLKITGLTFDEETVASECQIEDEDLKVHILYMYTSFSNLQRVILTSKIIQNL